MNLIGRIITAAELIRPPVRRTPMEKSPGLSQVCQADVYLKCEHLQRTGSFKLRGATYKILTLPEAQKRNGIITASTGNHGLAVATAGSRLGVTATIFTPRTASAAKLAQIEKLGATLERVDGDCLTAELAARETARTLEKTYISPYNDLDVIAGQGTIGLEMFAQCPDLEAVFVSVGGGGLIAGIASFLKLANPAIKVVGCAPENSAAMFAAIKAGEIVDAPELPTISDGTAGPIEPGAVTFPICAEMIDRCVTVNETQICTAMRLLAVHERWIVEGAAGVALAGLLKLHQDFKGLKVGVVLCGRNIVLEQYLAVIGGTGTAVDMSAAEID